MPTDDGDEKWPDGSALRVAEVGRPTGVVEPARVGGVRASSSAAGRWRLPVTPPITASVVCLDLYFIHSCDPGR